MQRLFFPNACVLCLKTAYREYDLCEACEEDLPWIENACPQCSKPQVHSLLCGNCIKQPPKYDHVYALFEYQFPIDKLVTGFKYGDRFQYGAVLSKLLTNHFGNKITNNKPDLIIPVPLHPRRMRKRGFNQALELAKPLSKKFNIPLDNNVCKRIKYTLSQSERGQSKRKSNLRGAFISSAKMKLDHVTIIDDIVTTGSTINSLASCLKKAGVKKVDVWCVGRTSNL